MQDDVLSKDPSAQWPEEVKQAYRALKIPTLYDAVLANEKVSFEVRRQNRELKNIGESLQHVLTQLTTLNTQMKEEWGEIEGEEGEGVWQVDQNNYDELEEELSLLEEELEEKGQVIQALLDAYDHLRDVTQLTKQMEHQLTTLLSDKVDVTPAIEEMMHNFAEFIERFRYRLLGRLKEIDIEIIDPQIGERFNASFHKTLETIPGGKRGFIAQVVRAGYQQRGEILRLAEVTVYDS